MNKLWTLFSKLKRNFEFQFSEAIIRRRLTQQEQENHPYNIENSNFNASTSIFEKDFDDDKIRKIANKVRDIQSEQRLMNAISKPFLEKFGAISFPWIYIQELCEKKNLFNFSYIDEKTSETGTQLTNQQLKYISKNFRVKNFIKFVLLFLFTVGALLSEIFLSNVFLRISFILIIIYLLFFKDKFGTYLIKFNLIKKLINDTMFVKHIFPRGIDYYPDELVDVDRSVVKVFTNHTGSKEKLSYISNNINEFWSSLQKNVKKEDILMHLSNSLTYEVLKPLVKGSFEKELIKNMDLSDDFFQNIDQDGWKVVVLHVKSYIEKYYYYFNKTEIVKNYFKEILASVYTSEVFFEEMKSNDDHWNQDAERECISNVREYENDLLLVLSSNLNIFFKDNIFYNNYFTPSFMQIDPAIEIQSRFEEKEDGGYHTIIKSRNDNIPLYALRTSKSYLLINFFGSFEEKEAIQEIEKVEKNPIDLPLLIANKLIS